MKEINTKYGLMPLKELQEMLGYSDLKYTNKWCNENEVLTIKIGKRWYAYSWMFEIALMREIRVESFYSGMDGNEIVNAILNDDKVKLAELMNVPVNNALIKKTKKVKKVELIEDIFEKYKKKIG